MVNNINNANIRYKTVSRHNQHRQHSCTTCRNWAAATLPFDKPSNFNESTISDRPSEVTSDWRDDGLAKWHDGNLESFGIVGWPCGRMLSFWVHDPAGQGWKGAEDTRASLGRHWRVLHQRILHAGGLNNYTITSFCPTDNQFQTRTTNVTNQRKQDVPMWW